MSATARLLSLKSFRGGCFSRGREQPTAASPAADILYLLCGGCREVTAHSEYRQLWLPVTSADHDLQPQSAVLREIVCDVCGHAQPRVIGDRVYDDTEIECTARRGWLWFTWRSCRQVFSAPAESPWPVCPRCRTVQHPRLSAAGGID